MSSLTYNSITLKIIRTLSIRRDAVLSEDRAQYHYTRWVIEVQCVYNPQATAYASSPPAATAGTLPTPTDIAIRHQLMQPRQRLQFDVGSNTLLTTPAAGYTIDADNGPKPLECSVIAIKGQKSFAVYYKIEACVIECPSGSPPVMLSNRWTEIHEIDENFFTVRTVQGRARFRSDEMLKQGYVPDQYRDQLVKDIPPNFYRAHMKFGVSEDGNEIFYVLIDRERPISYGADCPATKIEAFLTLSGVMGESGVKNSAQIQVRLWGQKQSAKIDLLTKGMQIVTARMPIGLPGCPIVQFSTTYDLLGKFVEIMVAQQIPTPPSMSGGAVAWVSNSDALGAIFALDGEDIESDEDGVLFTEDETGNPLPPGDGISRGTMTGDGDGVALLLSQTLSDACSSPDDPADETDNVLQRDGNGDGPPVTSIRTLGTLPEVPTAYSADSTLAAYDAYEIDMRYETESHILQCPVADPDMESERVACEMISVAAPTTVKVVDWKVSRLGMRPVLPSVDTGDPNDVILKRIVQPASNEVAADGYTKIWTVTGRYIYGLVYANLEGDDMSTGNPAHLVADPTDSTLTATDFQDGILGTGPALPVEPSEDEIPGGYSTLQTDGGTSELTTSGPST